MESDGIGSVDDFERYAELSAAVAHERAKRQELAGRLAGGDGAAAVEGWRYDDRLLVELEKLLRDAAHRALGH